MNRALVLLLLSLPAVADIEYATVKAARQLPASLLQEEFRIYVEDGGRILMASKEWLTLRQLDGRFAKVRAEYDKKHKAGPVSELPVVLHVDRNAPWFHVQLVLKAAAKARCPRVWFAVESNGRKYINANLPMDLVDPGKSTTFMMNVVRLVPRGSKMRQWPGGRVVTGPTSASYLFDGYGTPMGGAEAKEYAAMIASFEGKSVICRAVIIPTPRTPFGLVAEATQLFDRSRYRSVEFADSGPVLFPQETRRLPYPPAERLDPTIVHGIGDPLHSVVSKTGRRRFEGGRVDSAIRLPLAPAGVPDRDPGREGRTVINLGRNGEIRVGGWEMDLRTLLVHLASEVYPDHSELPPRILLRVDRAAPWQHVMQLLTALSRRGFESVEFAVRRRADGSDPAREALVFGVPRDDSAADPGAHAAMFQLRLRRDPPVVALGDAVAAVKSVDRDSLHMKAERMVDATFGPKHASARRPLDVRFFWNAKSTYSYRQLVRWIHEQRAAQLRRKMILGARKLRVVAAIDEKVPAGFAIAILARLKEMGWGEIYCFEPLEQDAETLLDAETLPYPESNRELRGEDGLGEIPIPRRSSSAPR
ncbi:MAG: ExbD/TolR family protein [Planctomycetota bacterium]|jgi:biopolymer transport protein ExbD